MKYCVRGSANIWGGHEIELLMEMVQWLEATCRTPYVIPKYDEAKFADLGDAEDFARKWFEPGNWRLREMSGHCREACCHTSRRQCPPLHAPSSATAPMRPRISLHHP